MDVKVHAFAPLDDRISTRIRRARASWDDDAGLIIKESSLLKVSWNNPDQNRIDDEWKPPRLGRSGCGTSQEAFGTCVSTARSHGSVSAKRIDLLCIAAAAEVTNLKYTTFTVVLIASVARVNKVLIS